MKRKWAFLSKIALNNSVVRIKNILNLNMKSVRLTCYKKVAIFGQIFQIYIKAIKQRIVMLDQGDVKIGLFPNLLSGF